MSTLIVTGSPRENMYSDRIGKIMERLSQGKLIPLRKMKIGPCHACGYCKEINTGECIQRDDMQNIYKDIRNADTIAIISPVYWWQVTAQTKLFMDRLYALEKEDLEGKKLVVVINGEGDEGDEEYENLRNAFRMMTDYLGMTLFFHSVPTKDEASWEKAEKGVEEFFRDALKP